MLRLVDAAADSLLRGETLEAARAIECALDIEPRNPEALHIAALTAARQQQFVRAVELLNQALQAYPDRYSWLVDLGVIQFAARCWSDTIVTLERASSFHELNLSSLHMLGAAYIEIGNGAKAEDTYRRALLQDPRCAKSVAGLGYALRITGAVDAAVEAFRRSLELDPALRMPREQLADIYRSCGFPDLELEQRTEIAHRNLDDADASLQLARSQFQVGETGISVEEMRRQLGECSPMIHSEYLGMLLHEETQTAHSLRVAHRSWAARFARASDIRWKDESAATSDRPLRIGYICGEFCSAPSYHFLMPLLRLRDRASHHVTCYHTGPVCDSYTVAYRQQCDSWRHVYDSTDEELCKQIRDDAIDVLVDLSGHYDHHRLMVFAKRPSPIQIAYPNYPSTTGLNEIDYIFTDHWACPKGAEAQYTEKPLKIRPGYLSYLPPRAPAIPSSPCGDRYPVTFGIFQRPSKFSAQFWTCVERILVECPRSQLLVQYASNDLDELNSESRRRVYRALSAYGVAQNRILFRGPVSRTANLEMLSTVDIALDTFPYNGQTTTCECLWMGVPVVTLAGEYHVARVGSSLLNQVGLPELVARNDREYVRIACDLASARQRLSALRMGLRDRMRTSALMDGRSVRRVESAYRTVWREWRSKNCKSERRS